MRERVDEEESVAWMADPFPDVSVIYSNVHPSIEVVREEEEEEEGRIVTIDESIFTMVCDDGDVM